MCGISAIINTASKAVGLDCISRMNALIRHRGPDGESFFIDRSVAMGHRMLKILDLGPANVQPMRLKNYVITYNGEIYNFKQLRQELKKLGYSFYTDTDRQSSSAA
jgi:asparagine synthase (glutamine-hydrolysing)